MRIGIDYDETLANSAGFLLKRLNEVLGTNHVVEDIDKWNYHNALGLEKEWFWKFYHDTMETATPLDIWPNHDANDYISKLAKTDDLYILTARQHKFRSQLCDWVEFHFPKQFRDVYTCGGQQDGIKKIDMMKITNLDCLVDDSYIDVITCRDEGLKSILYDAPHNRDHFLFGRARSWFDVYRYVDILRE